MSPFVALAGVLFRRDGTVDPTAYSVLVRAVGEVARQWGKSQDERHDLLHDLVLKLLLKRPSAEAECREEVLADEQKLFGSCLHVARNHLTDEYRRARRVRAEDPAVLDAQAGPDRPGEYEQELDLTLIDHPKAEDVLRLLLYQKLTVCEVARTMGMTERNVRGLRLLGVRRLRKRYTRDSDDHPG